MKLIKIEGDIWLLTRQQDGIFGNIDNSIDEFERNKRAIKGYYLNFRGTGRLLSNNGVRSLARAIIEINTPLPRQNTYTIYHCSKGFYCKVQGHKVYLKDLLECEERKNEAT